MLKELSDKKLTIHILIAAGKANVPVPYEIFWEEFASERVALGDYETLNPENKVYVCGQEITLE